MNKVLLGIYAYMETLRIKLFKLVLISVLVCQLGCGTAINLAGSSSPGVERRVPFGGVYTDIGMMSTLKGASFVVVFDLPLSLAADIATLPFTVPYTLLKNPNKNQDKAKEKHVKRIELLEKDIVPPVYWNQVYKISGDENASEWISTDKLKRIIIEVAQQLDLKLVESAEVRIRIMNGNDIGVYVISDIEKKLLYLVLTNFHSGKFSKKYLKLVDRLEKELKKEFDDRFHKMKGYEEEYPSGN